MLKQQHGGTDAAMCVPDDRPRKKLSFRDPEVVTPTRNGGAYPASHRHSGVTTLSHPSVLHHHSPQQHHYTRPSVGRPHSIAGIVGLGGFSALGGVPGVANPTSVPGTQCVTSPGPVSGVTSMLGNPGLLGPVTVPGILAGPVTPILTPPSSPSQQSSLQQQQQHPSSLSAKTVPSPSNQISAAPGRPGATQPVPPPGAKHSSNHPPTPTLKKSANHQSTSSTRMSTANTPSPPVTKTSTANPIGTSSAAGTSNPATSSPISGGGVNSPTVTHQSKTGSGSMQQTQANAPGKSLPPSGSTKSSGGQTKPTKPASRNSSMKKQRPALPVQQAVAFLTERGILNGRHRSSSQNDGVVVTASLEDIDLESQAMRIVRTVGQAFEVCHKISVKDTPPSPEPPVDEASEHGSEISTDKPRKDLLDSESAQEDLVTLTPSDIVNEDSVELLPQRPNKLEPLAPPVGSDILSKPSGETYTSPLSEPLPSGDTLPQAGTPLSVHHELQLLREQLEQQQQQTQAAVAQVHLLRDQLAAETAARLEAQARTHQLLVHNKELLEHIQALVIQVRDLEVKLTATGVNTITQLPPTLPEIKSQGRTP